jgi:hypothetical protein
VWEMSALALYERPIEREAKLRGGIVDRTREMFFRFTAATIHDSRGDQRSNNRVRSAASVTTSGPRAPFEKSATTNLSSTTFD